MARAIFVTASLTHGGAERHSIAVMNRLAERGHECHAVYIKNVHTQLDRIRLRNGGTVRCLNATRYFDGRALADFAAYISRVRPAAIVAANPYALMYSSLALGLSRLRVRLVVTYHSTRLLGAKEQLQMMLYRLFFWTTDCSVFVCERQRRYWLRRGVFSRRNEVIYNGVDTEQFCDGGDPRERAILRRVLGFSDADYVLGIPALLRREKNHLQLVEAIATLRNRGIPARALMIGDGEMRGAVEARARELNVENDVVITGLQQDVRPYIAACDAMVLCSFTEAFSVAAIEAMALRRPLVHSDVGGAAEMIVPGCNGFLFPVGDTKALVEKLAILADRTVSTRMGKNARDVVERRFSERTMVDRYERLLLDLCRTRSGAREAMAS
ncbi:MAG: glycosyltransferase family 4 protein [Betaproteobacteria bacterium]|nr:MAG: glycosyltransferase family 4 protein [Betaproteobacteria bacterium]TMH89325.1 MAG: glycosyltransferase family 4 protein [Betaproteobacteria bacterium]